MNQPAKPDFSRGPDWCGTTLPTKQDERVGVADALVSLEL
jgi:hypothetical protein